MFLSYKSSWLIVYGMPAELGGKWGQEGENESCWKGLLCLVAVEGQLDYIPVTDLLLKSTCSTCDVNLNTLCKDAQFIPSTIIIMLNSFIQY